jgi:uncharacterized protein
LLLRIFHDIPQLMYRKRVIPLLELLNKRSVLLLGPRRTGKSAFIREELPQAKVYNLLAADVFLRLSQRPQLIREALRPGGPLVVIDEIQKLPSLLDEVHLMIEETGQRFLLTGSSARKLRRQQGSLLAGRLRAARLHPFVSAEVPDFDLERVLTFGMMPPIFLSDEPGADLESYVGEYLQEEIRAEALARNIEGFSRFLRQAALANTELLNFESVARDAQVPARTIREYYSVLEDTLLGSTLEPLQAGGRKPVAKAKFYFFDIGVVHAVQGVRAVPEGTDLWGRAFETLVFTELSAYASYFGSRADLKFWRTQTHDEVDFVWRDVAIEVKSSRQIHSKDLKGLRALSEDQSMRRRLLVCREPERRKLDKIEIIPFREFFEELWAGELG